MESRVLIIGLAGLQGAGKSTVANHLANKYGFVRYSFSKPLKDAAKIIYYLSDEQLYGNLKNVIDERYGITPRFILQQLGTEVCRCIHQDTWILAARNFIQHHIKEYEKYESYRQGDELRIVIDDCRFENEATFVLLGNPSGRGRVFKVYGRSYEVEGKDHQSEKGLPDHYIDAVIDNSGDYFSLTSQVDTLITELS